MPEATYERICRKMFDPQDFSASAITDADEARLRISKAGGILLDWNDCAAAAGLPSLRTLVLGNPRMKALARQVGMRLVQEEADVVVLLRDTKFSYAKLERAIQSLAKGARLIVSNPDAPHPSEDGLIVPEDAISAERLHMASTTAL